VSLLIQLLTFAGPVLTALVVQRAIGAHGDRLLRILPALICALVLAYFAAGHVRTTVMVRLEAYLDARLTTRVVTHLLSLPLPFFEQRANGDLKQRVSSTFAIRDALTTQSVAALLDGAHDAITEQQIQFNLDQLSCTRIVIAHRMSTVRTADDILVLDNGRIVERGSHEQLLAHNGVYAELVQRQNARDTHLKLAAVGGRALGP
jgi:ABC-type bacteriocin/lantibiotic exporter with double-glycine peptidase domain